MIPVTFDYEVAESVEHALALLGGDPDVKVLAGGHSLVPALKLRIARPSKLVDIGRLSGLAYVRDGGTHLAIGALTRHAAVQHDLLLQEHCPIVSTTAGMIGDPQVRHRGTIGGSVANADPAADYPAAVLGLGATIVTDRREIAADIFFTAMFQTALQPGEIIVAVRFPIPDAAGYAKFKSQASRYALVGAFVARFGSSVRVAITGAGPVVFRSKDIEDALAANFSPQALARISIAPSGLSSDIHADNEYRAHLVVVMARRAVEQALMDQKPS